MSRLSLFVTFLIVWLLTGIVPVVPIQKGPEVVVARFPLLAAWTDPVLLWPFILAHLAIAVTLTAGIALSRFLWRRSRRPTRDG